MMSNIVTIGEILVEILAKEKGKSFLNTQELLGPYPSGAPAIFIDQAAKIGSSCGIISVVGDDDFGRVNLNKLKEDGVDVSNVFVDKNLATGVAFVTYHLDGNRDFIFHLKNSATSKLRYEMIDMSIFDDCKYFHIMGSSLFNDSLIECAKKIVDYCKNKGIKISFDPNIRKELLNDNKMKEVLLYIYDKCDIFLPSEAELSMFIPGFSEKEALLNSGKEIVVLKKGAKGCIGAFEGKIYEIKAFESIEIDPTGAGDCFGGTFISCLNQNFGFEKSLIYANKAGSIAVSKRGPMSGNTTLSELEISLL